MSAHARYPASGAPCAQCGSWASPQVLERGDPCPACGATRFHDHGDYRATRAMPDGRVLTVQPRSIGASIVTLSSQRGWQIGIWDEAWWYPSEPAAMAAMEEWDGYTPDLPDGWERHQPSNRRREGGDPARETVWP